MQVISMFEQPSSPSSSSSSSSSSMNLIENITKILEKGQESAHQIRKLFNEGLRLKVEDDHQADLDHHSRVTLNSFETVLSMIKTYAFDQKDKIKKRKIESPESPHSTKSDESGGTILSKERRGCYKRRRGDQSWTVEATPLIDDGHAWRKYGQKEILNTNYPRSYYRCTHKHDQKCQAIKQVQQISENPTKYNITYHGKHTCQNLNNYKTPSFIIENPEEKLSAASIYFCFETNNITKSKHSNLFPTSSINPDPTPVKVIKQECTLIKEESSPPLISIDLDHLSDQTTHNNLQYSSSCSDNYVPSSSDLTSAGLCSTPVSDQGDAISAFDMFGTDDDLFNLITLDDHHYNDRLDGMFETISN